MSKDAILKDFPDCFESERLVICAPRPGDGQAVFEAIEESRDHLRPWMPWANADHTVDAIEANARRAAAAFQTREDLRLNLWRKSDKLFVGGSGLHRIDWQVPRFEIGYWVRARLEGQGYITEAVTRIRDFAFEVLEAERVEICCDHDNTRSAAVAERAGFTLEARLRHFRRNLKGELTDKLIYALLRDDWTK